MAKAIETSTPSRRALLRGAAVVSVLAAPALIATTANAAPADPLIALEISHRNAEARAVASCEAHDEAEHKGSSEAVVGALDAAYRAAVAEEDRILRAIASTPAPTAAGLAVKLRFIKRDIEEGETAYATELVDGAIADAERLAGGAA